MDLNNNIPREVVSEVEENLAIKDAIIAMVIDSPASFENAADELAKIKGKRKRLEAKRVELKAPILLSGKGIDDFFRVPDSFLDDCEKAIKGRMLVYSKEVDRLAKIESDRIAEEERKARAAEREAQRVAQAIEDERARKERERLADIAKEAEEAGEHEEAAGYMQMAAEEKAEVVEIVEAKPIAAPVVQKAVAKGVSMRDNHKGEVTDLMALVKAVAAGTAPIGMLKEDQSAVNKFASATKGAMAVPGIKFTNDKILSSRSA